MNLFRPIALTGDALFILWILYNGIDEGARNVGKMEAVALTSLVILLVLNFILLWKKK